ncbi:MAG TPA: NAD(P)/FAD-dependent oxidoreductase [Lachnospiraceae bacterium]|nr:NAD(P)/FAD-dependent oxidoreductase [Lachnospiraceae bacterium]
MSKIIIVGGGASGMLASILLSRKGNNVTLLEQNEKLGKKLFITGKGRCNFTNVCARTEFLENVVTNPKFLYSAFEELSPEDTLKLFESWGLSAKIERGKRAFPSSDRSSDVIDMLKKKMTDCHVKVRLNARVTGILIEDGRAAGVSFSENGKEEEMRSDRVIIATGGESYPSTGSTGDGYRFAEDAGLKVTGLLPSLVSIECEEDYCATMQGLSLKNVELHVHDGKKEVFHEFGEMMFTHYGVTGPVVLTASAVIGPLIGKKPLSAYIDLKPAVTPEMLDTRLIRLFDANPNKDVKNVIHELYPAKLAPVIPGVACLNPEKKIHDVTRADREAIISATKHLPLTFKCLRGFDEAVVTKGGVSVKEIDPKTMECKKIKGLYFIGEVLDLDALTGGFNLQIAWSTAAAAASAPEEEPEETAKD